jgi:hypothetical protein
MSLNVILFDKRTQEPIKVDVLIDESTKAIKDKLFAYHDGIEYYPNFLKLELDTKLITEDNSLLLIQDNSSSNTVYVTNIFNEMEQRVEQNKIDINTLFNPSDTTTYDDLLTEFQKEFTELTEADFDFVIKLMLLKSNPALHERFQKDIEEFIQIILEKKEKESDKYKKLSKGLQKYTNVVTTIDNWGEYFDNVIHTYISVLIKSKKFESGVKGKYIKLDQIFNQLELSEKIPFVAITSGSGDPLIKVYDRLIETVSEREVRSWILNEKKKANITTYKKMKGLVVKYKYDNNLFLTFNLQNNGVIGAKLTFKDSGSENRFEYEINKIKNAVDDIVEQINNLQGVFLKSKRLDHTKDSDISLESISGFAKVEYLIDKGKFAKELNNVVLAEYLFEIKDTISEDILSIYYKKFGKRETDEHDIDRKGITVNIRDNPYKLNSSIINVYGAYSVNQIIVILKQVIAVSQMFKGKTAEYKQKIKEKSNIKDLRKQGVNILSTKCQKPRQPILDNGKLMPFEKSYTLEYNGLKYVCPKKDYPYPGFTNENIVCCFKKDQRKRDAYIRNTQSKDFDIIVQPSNLKVKITDGNETYETFVIKIVSEYNDGFNDENSMSRYYFISNNNVLTPITNDNSIVEMEENNIWLEAVPLAQVISEPPKNKCNFLPKMENKSNKDINSPCVHHRKNKIFGYNLNSYPCCFDKEREVEIKRKKKTFDIKKQHIFTSDKILDYERIGVLTQNLDTLFNRIINKGKKDNLFYRMGVTQNNSAFLSVVLMAMNNKIKDDILNNSNDLRKYIARYISLNNTEYLKLNGGNIAIKYGKIDNYIKSILDVSSVVYWGDVIDILQRLCEINIIMIDVPYKITESTKIADYDNIKLICNPNIKINKANNYIFVIKRINSYELVIRIEGNDIIQQFNSKHVTNVFDEYNELSCVKEEVFPEQYPYDELYKLIDLQDSLKDTIKMQYVNGMNKVIYVGTNKGLIIPIKETGISNSGIVKKIAEIKDSDLLDVYEYKLSTLEVNKVFRKSGLKELNIKGVTIDINTDTGSVVYTSVLTNFGQLVPIKKTNYNSKDNFIILDFKYYPDVEKYILSENGENEQQKYFEQRLQTKERLYAIKKSFGEIISKDDMLKTSMMEINTNSNMSRDEKLEELIDLFKFMSTVSATESEYQQIANEVLNDNIENLLMNNLITKESFNPNEVTSRDTEALLTNINEVQGWFRRHKRSD